MTTHYAFALAGVLPEARPSLGEMVRFKVDYTLFLNAAFGLLAAALFGLHFFGGQKSKPDRG